jgi:cellulose synthase/poly-beta-1,6-N-acetylglucosamine synthase-like glycosyltransferase
MIDIVISSKNRFNYLRITFATLKEALREVDTTKFKIFLWDDSKNSLPSIVNEFSNLEIIRQGVDWSNKSTHFRCNNIITETFSRSDKEYILQVDSDSVFHPLFYNKCLELIKDLPDIGYASVFNTPGHKVTEVIKGKYAKKNLIGAFGTLINRFVWEKLLKSGHMKTDDMERGLANFCNTSTQYGVCTTVNSYIEHIGQTGLHHREDDTIDRAINFYNE